MKKLFLFLFSIFTFFIFQTNIVSAQHLFIQPKPYIDVTQHLNAPDLSYPDGIVVTYPDGTVVNYPKGTVGNYPAGTVVSQGVSISNPKTTFTTLTCSLYRPGSTSKLSDLFDYFTCLVSRFVVPLIFSVAFIIFAWGVTQYILNGQEEAKREKGRQFMIWGIIALTVMFTIWGLVSLLKNTFNLDNAAPKSQDVIH
jgi:hypothetical protein